MKNCLKIFEAAACALISVVMIGCAGKGSKLEGGRVLTPELLESIRESVTQSETGGVIAETDSDGNRVYYWVAGGSVIHADRECGYIAKSENVKSGSAEDASENYNIQKKCSACAE